MIPQQRDKPFLSQSLYPVYVWTFICGGLEGTPTRDFQVDSAAVSLNCPLYVALDPEWIPVHSTHFKAADILRAKCSHQCDDAIQDHSRSGGLSVYNHVGLLFC